MWKSNNISRYLGEIGPKSPTIWRFPTHGNPQIIHFFHRIFHDKPSILDMSSENSRLSQVTYHLYPFIACLREKLPDFSHKLMGKSMVSGQDFPLNQSSDICYSNLARFCPVSPDLWGPKLTTTKVQPRWHGRVAAKPLANDFNGGAIKTYKKPIGRLWFKHQKWEISWDL